VVALPLVISFQFWVVSMSQSWLTSPVHLGKSTAVTLRSMVWAAVLLTRVAVAREGAWARLKALKPSPPSVPVYLKSAYCPVPNPKPVTAMSLDPVAERVPPVTSTSE
jgi:hypothetical protein